MAAMKDYVIWAACQLEKDYPGHEWEFYMYLVTDTNICSHIERYSMKRYLKEVNSFG